MWKLVLYSGEEFAYRVENPLLKFHHSCELAAGLCTRYCALAPLQYGE